MAELFIALIIDQLSAEICLPWRVNKQLRKLATMLETIQALLSDAQSKQLTSRADRLWMKMLQFAVLDAEIVLDQVGYQVLRQKIESRKRDKVRRLFSSSIPVSLARKVSDVISSLEKVDAESFLYEFRRGEFKNSLPDPRGKRLTDPFVEDSEIVGRHDDISRVINMLIDSDYHMDLPVITILGMGGQGKTTLAKVVYKNEKVQSHFDKRTIWFCVSDDFNVQRLLAKMLQSLTMSNSQLTNTEGLVSRLKEELSGKRYLLVLDDVWNQNSVEWNRFRTFLLQFGDSKGSRILATTRSEVVASVIRTSGCHLLQALSPEHSWELFEKYAFAEGGAIKTPELVDIGKRILERCGGVPLAIRAIGGLLYSMHSTSEWIMIEKSGLWSDFSSEGKGVLSAIKRSYDHLPSLSAKQCFAYCAIFEKDTWMEKDMLIQLWMAQGLLNPPKGSDLQMEDIGSEYFNILLRSSLLQDAERDDINNITHCKMHDLVHDFSLQVLENYCFHVKDWKQVRYEIEAVHLSITAGEREMWKSLKGIVPSRLRTLHLKGRNVLEEDLSATFKCLFVLIVEDEDAKELPNWIGQMKHLRFLDISRTKIRKLPKSIAELYYLQTLRVNSLVVVPEGCLQKLINLRAFLVMHRGWWDDFLFPRIGQLTSLQTLPFFMVGKRDGCQIEELEHLDNLKGALEIFGLENVNGYESALKANLSKRSNIQSLKLHWEAVREEGPDESNVLKGLKPHSNLKSLEIDGYQGNEFPSWMMSPDIKQLGNLVKLELQRLNKCESLPSLGDLPCLEYLCIKSLNNVKCIGKKFYEADASTPFPALKTLEFWHMRSVVEWVDAIIPTPLPSSSVIVQIFPKLEKLYIKDLPMLEVFPYLGCLPSLQRLDIINCQNLEKWSDAIIPPPPSPSSSVNIFSKLEEMCIRGLPKLRALPNLGCLSSLRQLEIRYCRKLTLSSNPDIHYLQLLRQVIMWKCGDFTAAICRLKLLALESLTIRDNPSLWPKDLHHLTSLRKLYVGGFSSEVDCFPFLPHSVPHVTSALPPLDHVQYFPSLTSLTLCGYGLPKVTSLSDQIQYLTTLTDLTIYDFDLLEALPEWLGNLRSLQNLQVRACKNLKQLSSAEAFQRLTKLQRLQIYNCPLLKERCTEGSGSEWPKIAHIPKLIFHDW